MQTNPQLLTFTKEIFNGKLQFLCSVRDYESPYSVSTVPPVNNWNLLFFPKITKKKMFHKICYSLSALIYGKTQVQGDFSLTSRYLSAES